MLVSLDRILQKCGALKKLKFSQTGDMDMYFWTRLSKKALPPNKLRKHQFRRRYSLSRERAFITEFQQEQPERPVVKKDWSKPANYK